MSLRDYKSLRSRCEIARRLQIPGEQRGYCAGITNPCGAVGGCKDYKSLQSKMYIGQELVIFLPGGHDLAENGKFSDMVGVVIGHDQDLAEDGEIWCVRNGGIQVNIGVFDYTT